MRYAIMTAKHHDGFANWPSTHSDFSVAASSWRDGKGDVVREFVEACRAHGIHVGLYYSPADWWNPDFKQNAQAYDQYFLGQLRELLTEYGDLDIIWFDGCGSDDHPYDWDLISSEIRTMQPNILIGVFGDPDYRWVGNEAGFAPSPCWNVVPAASTRSVRVTDEQRLGQRWLPAECDCRMRAANWFYSDQDAHTVKSVEELMGLYYYSVGRGANLLLNIGPDRRGLLPDLDTQRLLELGSEIRRRFGEPFAPLSEWKPVGTGLEYEQPTPFLVDHVIVQEDLSHGERVRQFAVRIPHGAPITLYEGRSIGHKAICRFPLVSTRKVIIDFLETDGEVRLRSLELHNSAR